MAKHLKWLIPVLTAFGCQAVEAPSSMVAARMSADGEARQQWLESATLTYVHSPRDVTAGSSIMPVSHSEASEQAAPSSRVARVLAIRFPHPDGRRDVARGELIWADADEQRRQPGGWRARVGRALSSATPGVDWGPGIKQAKGLDIPLAELEPLLQAARAGQGAEGTPDANLQMEAEINGQRLAPSAAAAPLFDALAARIATEGRLISYPGGAAELLDGATSLGSANAADR